MSKPSLLSGLQTEESNPRSANIDIVPTLALCQIINKEDALVPSVVKECLGPVVGAIDCLVDRVRKGGRVIYVGAGTSGRLGVLDASEIPPTYSAPVGQFVGLIAGGDVALRSAREGAEDSVDAGVEDLKAANIDGERDSLIGITSSGRTPYVLGCVEFAKSKGCATVGIVCTSSSVMAQKGNVDFLIEAVTGPEVITGSTRMKAGTATKLILNTISSGIMIKLGKTFGNIMVDVKPTNTKLEHRARHIIREIVGPQCTASDEELETVLARCEKSVKLASVVLKFGISTEEARERLNTVGGVLAKLIPKSTDIPSQAEGSVGEQEQLVVCVDAGGSKCRATVLNSSGQHATDQIGSCNVSEIGPRSAALEIKLAIERAMMTYAAKHGKSFSTLTVSAAWIGVAGGDRRGLAEELKAYLSRFLPHISMIRVTNDLDILATVAGANCALNNMVIIIAGTGSIAKSYQRRPEDSQFVKIGRVGGWGPLLGDEGSGFDIGRQAIRYVLQRLDVGNNDIINGEYDAEDPLTREILDHYRPLYENQRDDYDLLSWVLSGSNGIRDLSHTKRKIANCARLVVEIAKNSRQAALIVNSAQKNLLTMVQTLLKKSAIRATDALLVLGGSVAAADEFQSEFITMMQSEGVEFMDVKIFHRLTVTGAEHLGKTVWGDVQAAYP